MKPLILLTNDDGINSPGIEVLANSLSDLGEVIIVAPDTQRSAVSSSLTIHKPLRIQKYYKSNIFFGYAVDGTPADCVKIAVSTFLDRKPDLVVSGINHGKNTSINVLYSGTVAGAAEGILAGINSIAISHSSHSLSSDLTYTSEYINKLARNLLSNGIGNKVLLNVNVPDLPYDEIKGAVLTKLSSSRWADNYEKRNDPFGNEYYWFAGSFLKSDTDITTDDGAVDSGYISVSPIRLNLYDDDRTDLKNILGFEDEQDGNHRRNSGGNGTG